MRPESRRGGSTTGVYVREVSSSRGQGCGRVVAGRGYQARVRDADPGVLVVPALDSDAQGCQLLGGGTVG